MAEVELEELESYHEKILKKYEFSGITSLSPSEICLTLISPSWEYYFFTATKTTWLSVVNSYRPTLLSHIKSISDDEVNKKLQENNSLRQQAGKLFLELLDSTSSSKTGTISDPSLKDDHILERLKDSLAKKSLSLLNFLTKHDVNNDGFLNKSEFVSAMEDLSLSPHDIVSLIIIAGYRPGVDKIPIAGFSDFLSRRGEDRKKEEYALFTKVFNAFNSKDKNISKVFSFLDANKDGVVTLEEMRQGLNKLNVSLSLSECKEVFAVLDKDRSGSISLDELKKRLGTLTTGGHELKGEKGNNVSGSLEIVLLKGQKFKNTAKSIKIKFGNQEFVTPVSNDVNPEWKYSADFIIENTVIQKVPREVEFEVFYGKKSEGKAGILFSEIRNTDVLKSKLDITVNKQAHGVLFVKSTWKESEKIEAPNFGSLALTLIKSENLSADVQFKTENKAVVLNSKTAGQTFRIQKLKKTPNMIITIQKADENSTKELNLSDIISEDKRTPFEIVIDKTKLFVQIIWEEFDPEDEREDVSATKIQALWRGYLVRHSRRLKNTRKLVMKKTGHYENRRYLLAVYEDAKNIDIEVHPADSNQIGTDIILSSNKFPLQDYSELIPKLVLSSNLKLSSILDKKVIRGSLQLKLLQVKGFPSSLLYFSLDNSSAVVSDKQLNESFGFSEVSFKTVPSEILCKVIGKENKTLLAEFYVYWIHAINSPDQWTFNTIVPAGENGRLSLCFQWTSLPDISKEDQAALVIQKNWRAKREREELKIRLRKNPLIGRKGFTVNGKIYLVSVVVANDEWLVELNSVDNPQVPSYEIIDKAVVKEFKDVEQLFKRISLENEKIIIS